MQRRQLTIEPKRCSFSNLFLFLYFGTTCSEATGRRALCSSGQEGGGGRYKGKEREKPVYVLLPDASKERFVSTGSTQISATEVHSFWRCGNESQSSWPSGQRAFLIKCYETFHQEVPSLAPPASQEDMFFTWRSAGKAECNIVRHLPRHVRLFEVTRRRTLKNCFSSFTSGRHRGMPDRRSSNDTQLSQSTSMLVTLAASLAQAASGPARPKIRRLSSNVVPGLTEIKTQTS